MLEWNNVGPCGLLIVVASLRLIVAENSTQSNEEMTLSVCGAFQTGGMERLAEFASPNYPQRYPPNVDCIRVIHAPPNYDIVFRFHDVFRIESSYEDLLAPARAISQNCPNDYLEIRDGRYSFSPLIGRFCGLEAPQEEIRVRSGYAWLNFHSDSLLEERGFSAEYEFVRRSHSIPKNPQECHFSYGLQLDGYINVTALSDFYDAGRPSNHSLECVYQIRVPNWLRVAIFIERFELAAPNQCSQNYLEIYAGATAREPLKRYCGIIATHTYTSETVVFIRAFVASDFHARQTKLSILFSSYLAQKNCSEHEMFECGDDVCIPESLVCNKRANCLYRRDENNCYEYKNFFTTLLLNTPIILLPVLIAGVMLLLAAVYKPWLTNSLSSQVLEIEAKEGTPLTPNRPTCLNAAQQTMTTTSKASQTDPANSSKRNSLNPPNSTPSTSKRHSTANTYTPSHENGECRQRAPSTPTLSKARMRVTRLETKADVWQAINNVDETENERIDTQESYVSIDV